jgi:replication-associated recombination protein RarA
VSWRVLAFSRSAAGPASISPGRADNTFHQRYSGRDSRLTDIRGRVGRGVTSLMKGIGYGGGYRYIHDDPAAQTEMRCLPERFEDRNYLDDDTLATGHGRR